MFLDFSVCEECMSRHGYIFSVAKAFSMHTECETTNSPGIWKFCQTVSYFCTGLMHKFLNIILSITYIFWKLTAHGPCPHNHHHEHLVPSGHILLQPNCFLLSDWYKLLLSLLQHTEISRNTVSVFTQLIFIPIVRTTLSF